MERIYPLLFQYLQSNKILLLPKIGTFSLSSVGSRYDYPTRSLQAPYVDFTFQGNVNNKKNDVQLYRFLETTLKDNPISAEKEVDAFSENLLQHLKDNSTVQLPGIGKLRYINEKILLETSYSPKDFFPDQPAMPVKRDDANTVTRAGDTEHNKSEMETLPDGNTRKKKWWIYLIIIVIVFGGIAAGVYYYTKMHGKL
ncbi:MAG: hypothetical protein QM610_13365 [Chitinophagaceae bacterium]